MEKLLKSLLLVLFTLTLSMGMTACGGDDDEPKKDSLLGKWELNEELIQEDGTASIHMLLTFNSNKTGSIVETWSSNRASSENVYSMEFSWSTTTDSNGNDILKVSYISGDKDTEIFMGGPNTVLWSRQYVQTGKILNIYDSSTSVWVFKKK